MRLHIASPSVFYICLVCCIYRMRYLLLTMENISLSIKLRCDIIFSRINATHQYATERNFGRGPSRSE